MQRPPNLTDAEWAEWLQCQEEEDELLAQVADREAKLEMGLIDSYDEYEFTWEHPGSDFFGVDGGHVFAGIRLRWIFGGFGSQSV